MKKYFLNSSHILGVAALAAIAFLSACETTSNASKTSSRTTATSVTTSSASSGSAPASEGWTAASPVATVSEPTVQSEANTNAHLPYAPRKELSGLLRSIGSDSMDQQMKAWEDEFTTWHPGLRVRHEGKGTSTAIPALLEGRADFGPMSRVVKASEVEAFEAKFGFPPFQIPVAYDTLAVYVHPSNPILKTGLNLDQLRAIFSDGASIRRWGQLGLQGEWAHAPIRLHSRNAASGTYGYFQDQALGKKPFHSETIYHAGSADVVRAVGADPYAIGYSGIAYATPAVRSVPLADGSGKDFFAATEANAASGVYPLTRSLYMTFKLEPSAPLSEMQLEFMRYVFSAEGQRMVAEIGYFPVDPAMARQTLRRLEQR